MNWGRNKKQMNNGRKKRDFGPNGHDYVLAYNAGPNSSPLTDDEINRLIADRLACKMAREFEDADEILDILRQNGIYINDGSKEWRADGVEFVKGDRSGRRGRQSGSR